MLLYSTIIDIKPALTAEQFIQLVIEWNQTSTHRDNVIPNLVWNGEHNIRYGNDSLSLDIEEYPGHNIIAVRYEKKAEDGAVWDTDYVMNLSESKMAIRLDRSYSPDAMMVSMKFSTPHFITLLIEKGYVADDGDLPVLRRPVLMGHENASLLSDAISGRKKYRFPLIYISKTKKNRDPLDCDFLCSRLKGVSHILVERSKDGCSDLCDDRIEHLGEVGIYFPNGRHLKYKYRDYKGYGEALLTRVVNVVLRYMNVQQVPLLYTWAGVNNQLLKERWESDRKEKLQAEANVRKKEDELTRFIETFDKDNKDLRQRNDELTRENNSLSQEVQQLQLKLSEAEDVPLLFEGDEDDFYPGEIREMVLDAVAEKLKSTKEGSRRYDVYSDILAKNHYRKLTRQRIEEIKNLLNDYRTMTAPLRNALADLGFKITEVGKHYRMTYYGDERYMTTLSKTGSDFREGKNQAANIARNMF
ncbi:hypothetical protein [Galactobacillus timonensis]|uniref:hypothetical protein n=1 Tax=Galactobacillus timonensis TaxID=2041840 RepID=UPI000C834F0A|nr:hypothetical protein [Galactobacillus timonensis]